MTDSSFIKQEVKKLKVRYLGKIHFDGTLENAIGNADRLAQTKAMKNLTVILREINL
jgi:hypothetical protein